ncbi:uncharacterized protein LOC123907657 isoform X2 [Trifolium pratense]|nr:uncharacterized protein LOC123907657 isoform X2 [Trifolium pratense]
MENYLKGQDLWDDVFMPSSRILGGDIEQGLGVDKTEYSMKIKDAKALHIIQISCGRLIQDELFHFRSAKMAWLHLRSRYGNISSELHTFSHEVILDNSFGDRNGEIFRKVERGDYIENIINLMSTDLFMTSSTSGRTLLHVAVIAGNVENVKILMKKGKERLLLMQDKDGDTALSLVARYTGNTNMAKCLLETKNGPHECLLERKNKENIIPILMAAAKGHKELTTYLYSKTRTKVFDGIYSENRILLFSLCITAEIFDVALRLLKRYEELPRESLSLYNFSVPKLLRESLSLPIQNLDLDLILQRYPDKFSALVALAKMPSLFPSGSQFGLREKLIYNILSVEMEITDNYGFHDSARFVRLVTSDVERSLPKTSTKCWSISYFFRQVLNILFLPVNVLGRLLWLLAYMSVHIFKYLNIFGIRKIYDQKYTHYEVLLILSQLCTVIKEFNYSELREASTYEAMLHAAQNGIIEFINAMKDVNPDLLSAIDNRHRGIFWYAIVNCRQNVFRLIYSLNGSRKDMILNGIDAFGNNLLHTTAQLGSSSDSYNRSGAALQMQNEIQWFKAVEELMHPMFREAKNVDGKKPYELFTGNHEELVKAGEKWTKEIASSYTAVASLILTIMFAAAFTIPGGNNQETGTPIFLHEKIFNMFIIADAVAIFTSASSVLVFIGIVTSRYAEQDFLKVLPLKLVLALVLLLLSVCSMMVAFYAALNVILKGNHTGSSRWFVLGPILSLGSVPVIILLISQLSFIYKILHSTIKNPISSI